MCKFAHFNNKQLILILEYQDKALTVSLLLSRLHPLCFKTISPSSLCCVMCQILNETIGRWSIYKKQLFRVLIVCTLNIWSVYTTIPFLLLSMLKLHYTKQSDQSRGGAVQCLACLTCNRWMSIRSVKPIKGSRCFIRHETLHALLITGWFQEWIRACFSIFHKHNYLLHTRTNIKVI